MVLRRILQLYNVVRVGLVRAHWQMRGPNIMLPAPMKTTLKSSPPATWVTLWLNNYENKTCRIFRIETHLSIGTSLDGSMDGRREDIPDPRRSEPRRSETDIMLWRWYEDGSERKKKGTNEHSVGL
jgi:hypothetical protein